MINSFFLSSSAMCTTRPSGLPARLPNWFSGKNPRPAAKQASPVIDSPDLPNSMMEFSLSGDQHLAAMTACELNRDGMLLIDTDGTVQYINRRASELLSVNRESIIGKPLVGGALDSKLAPPALVTSWLKGNRCFNLRRSGVDICQNESPIGNASNNAAEQKKLQLFYDVFDENSELPHRHLITIRDISDQDKYWNVWKKQAHTDVLTGLPNRRAFVDHLKRKMNSESGQARFALVFIDLNNFKPINDRYGHFVGDDVLRLVAGRLKKSLAKEHYCARLSGDEFAIILNNVADESSATVAMQQIRDDLNGNAEVQGNTIRVSISAGFSLRDGRLKTPEAMLQAADAAMYRCKRAAKAEVG